MADKLGAYDTVRLALTMMDDGGMSEHEAMTRIRRAVGLPAPLPDLIVLMGTLPFTVTIDTRTRSVEEFEINYHFPVFDEKAEKRLSGEEIEIDAEQLNDLIAAATADAGGWPEPEPM